MNVTATFSGSITLPDDVQVDDCFVLKSAARVVHVRRDLIDVRQFGSRDSEYVPGDLQVELLIESTDFQPSAEDGGQPLKEKDSSA